MLPSPRRPAPQCYCGFVKPLPAKLWRLLLTLPLKTYTTPLDGEPRDLVKPGCSKGWTIRSGWQQQKLSRAHVSLPRARLCSVLGAEEGLYMRQTAGRESTLCCWGTVPYFPYDLLQPEPASMERVTAAMQLHFMVPLRLIT